MRAPRLRACSYSSSTNAPAPSPNTKPSRSRSQGREAVVGSSLRVESARMAAKPPMPKGDTVDSAPPATMTRSEEHTSELQSLMRNSYAVLCLKKKNKNHQHKEENKTTIKMTI